jgi:effector-binding domain-containing protein
MAKDRRYASRAADWRPRIPARLPPWYQANRRPQGPEQAPQLGRLSMSCLRLGVLIALGFLAFAGPSAAQPAPAPPASKALQPSDPFGEDVILAAKPMVLVKGTATWDNAFDTLTGSFKAVLAALEKQGLKPAGPPMTIYTATDDTGFEFMAGFPVAEEPKGPLPPDLSVGKSPDGRALKFVHRGSYDSMDSTYEAITNHLEEKKLEARDLFMEQYITDPLKTPEDQLVIEVYVPVK